MAGFGRRLVAAAFGTVAFGLLSACGSVADDLPASSHGDGQRRLRQLW